MAGFLVALCLVLSAIPGGSAGATEAWYQRLYCTGEIEHRLADGTRVDCLTDCYAVEYDFARKWYEAVGQSLYYAMHTGRQAGIALIVEKEQDQKYVHRAIMTIRHYGLPIRVEIVDGDNSL